MEPDDFGTVYRYDSISGFALGRCAFLAYRTEPDIGLDPRRMESWVVLPSDNLTETGERLITVELGITGFLTGLFYAKNDTVYVTEMHGRVYVRRQEAGRPRWTVTDLGEDVELDGVWGVSDELIYVWGRDAWQPRLWRLQGDQLIATPAPPERTTILRGLRHDMLFAAGPHGFLARWDGAAWRRVRLPTRRNVTGLTIVDDDTYWLTTDNGKLFEGSSHGWALRAEHSGPLYDVASWAGRVVVAASGLGVRELDARGFLLKPLALDCLAIALEPRACICVAEQCVAEIKPASATVVKNGSKVLQRFRGSSGPTWHVAQHPLARPTPEQYGRRDHTIGDVY